MMIFGEFLVNCRFNGAGSVLLLFKCSDFYLAYNKVSKNSLRLTLNERLESYLQAIC